MLHKLKNHIQQNFTFLQDKKLLVATSGGLDSMVLVHLFQKLNFNFALAHCNFQLRNLESDADEEFVNNYAEQNKIPCFTTKFDTKKYSETHKLSTQVAARNLRYDWFNEILIQEKFDYIITAHHADDDVETFLIHISRGTGLEGLTGIPSQNGNIIRPMLPFSRKEIEKYASENQLVWREDSSNASDKYVRNKIRHHIVPVFKEINDSFLQSFQNTLEHLNQQQTLVDDAVRRILRQKFRLGLFENPFPDTTLVSKIGIKKHREIAKQAVRESLVLLKNENQVLPISIETKKIVVVGEHANNSGLQSGGWTVNWQGSLENYKGATTILEGIKKQSKGTVVYDKNATENHFDADLAIIVIGENPYAEFFGDIGHESNQLQLTLTEEHQNYIKKYSDKGIKTIVVLISGRPLVVTDQINQSNAFVAAWLPGSEGDGVAEVLFGDYNFKGKFVNN